MNVKLPTILNVSLTKEEDKIIENCIALLKEIQEEMINYDCSILFDVNGGCCTFGELGDIQQRLAVIRDAEEMCEG